MVDQIGYAKANKAAGVGTLTLTDPRITEPFSAAILLFTRTQTDDADVAAGSLGAGFIGVDGDNSNATLQFSIGPIYENGVLSNAAGLTVRSNIQAVRIGNNAASALQVVGVYNASVAGGVELNFTQCDIAITVTAILFAGLAKAATGGASFNDAAPSHETVGDAGDEFEPDLLILAPSDNLVTGDTPNGCLALGFALNKPGIPQIAAYLNYDNNTDPTDADGFYRADVASCAFIGDRILQQDRFAVTSFDSTGFNGLAVDTGSVNSPQANYLALKWTNPSRIRMACAHLSVAASTGLQSFNAFGFTPDLVFGMAHLLTTPDTITNGPAGSSGGMFVTGRYGSRAVAARMEEALNIGGAVTSDSSTRQGDHAALVLDHTNGDPLIQADWAGPSGNGGFALNFTTAGQAGTLTALGIQIIPGPDLAAQRAPAVTKRQQRRQVQPRASFGRRARGSFLRLLQFWEVQRRALFERLHQRKVAVGRQPVPGLIVENPHQVGDNALGGSERGGNAMAGSAQGD